MSIKSILLWILTLILCLTIAYAQAQMIFESQIQPWHQQQQQPQQFHSRGLTNDRYLPAAPQPGQARRNPYMPKIYHYDWQPRAYDSNGNVVKLPRVQQNCIAIGNIVTCD